MADKTKQKNHTDADYSLEAVPKNNRKKFWPMFFIARLYLFLCKYVGRCQTR